MFNVKKFREALEAIAKPKGWPAYPIICGPNERKFWEEQGVIPKRSSNKRDNQRDDEGQQIQSGFNDSEGKEDL